MSLSGTSSRLLGVSVDTPAAAPNGRTDTSVGSAAIPRTIPAVRLVATSDVAIVLVAFFAIFLGVNLGRMPNGLDAFLAMRVTVKNLLVIASLAAGVLTTFRWVGLYDASRLRRRADEVRRVLVGTAAITVLSVIVPLTSHSNTIERWSLLLFWLVSSCALVLARSLRATLTPGARERRRVIIVGTGPLGLRIYRELCADLITPYSVLGFVDTTTALTSPFLARRLIGTLGQLEELLVREHVDDVFLGLPVKSHYPQIEETIRICERLGVKATYRADIFDTELATPRMQAHDSTPRVHLHMAPEGARLMVKRLVDIIGATVGLMLLMPIMLIVAIAIKLTSDGPVIFSQERYGLNRRRFQMYKFRTMVRDADRLQASLESLNEVSGPVFKIANDPRMTRVGRFLRRSSIDELPQFFNVLRGEMSLVGPRPLPPRDVARFTRASDLRRFSVRPGVTCLWQVNGRSAIGFDDWIKLDLHYIDQWSLKLDLLILAHTVPAVFRGTGAR
jgi:exopolysaccharide biosynthesis polyprenyl glycosylphosphotransferase